MKQDVTSADLDVNSSVCSLQEKYATTSRAIKADLASDFLKNLTNEAITELLKNTGKSQKSDTRKN